MFKGVQINMLTELDSVFDINVSVVYVNVCVLYGY